MPKDFAPIDQPDLFGGADPPPSLIVNLELIGRACRYCRGESWLTLPGRGPHAMGVQCVTCGAHGGWVPRHKAEALWQKAGVRAAQSLRAKGDV
jgi:hypothetical protein